MNSGKRYFKESFRLTLLLVIFTMLIVPLYRCGGDGGPVSPDSAASRAVYPMFVDDDGNGVNDFVEAAVHNAGTSLDENLAVTQGQASRGHAFRDGNGDGICDYGQNGSRTWHGPGFVDEDGDGVCDWWDDDMPRGSQSDGLRYRDRNRNRVNDHFEAQWHEGCGHGFIDGDGDGICDRAQDGSPAWHGPGYSDNDGDGICDVWGPGGDGNYRYRYEHRYRHRHERDEDPQRL